jgi:hypothetical protein
MKKFLLFFSLLLSPIHAMEDTIKVEETVPIDIDTSVLTIPQNKRINALRIIMLNRLQEKDYTSVTHLIEKTKLHPGDLFIDQFERGAIIGKQIYYKIGGITYFLYKAAMQEDHKRLIRLIQDEGCFEHVSIYANSVFNDLTVTLHVIKNPQYNEQYEKYIDMVNASDNDLLIAAGKEPLSKEEWEESYTRARNEICDEWQERIRLRNQRNWDQWIQRNQE